MVFGISVICHPEVIALQNARATLPQAIASLILGLLEDERRFMVASQPPIPFDQPCLVALKFLSSNGSPSNDHSTYATAVRLL